jgi:2-methylcitrate dehydratase PrpD
MTKSLHAGRACEGGLQAALLAARGFTGAAAAIEGEQGFAAVSGGGCDAGAALADPPAGWYIVENLFKYHASCYWTHSAIEGIRSLIASHDLAPDAVERVALHVSELELGTCVVPAPASGLEVKFSVAHLVAMALLGRDTGVITDADARDRDVIALRGRVSLVDDGTPGTPTRVELTTRHGTTVEAAVDVNAASRDLPGQYGRLVRKFERLAAPVIGEDASAALRELVGRLDGDVAVRELTALTQPGSGERAWTGQWLAGA